MSEAPGPRAGDDERLIWAPRAWVGGRWRDRVLLRADGAGNWAEISPDTAEPPPGAEVIAGPALPGMVNGHSHAFQRAFAGLAERLPTATAGRAPDDFWAWRERMYRVALRLTPDQLRAVAAQLDLELLRGGYTQVCEFHYLHHDEDGRPYADPAALSWALADGAADAGIGLTVLPVLYERSGFDATALREEQRRFTATPAFVRSLHQAITGARRPLVDAGVAIHSLRAASPAAIEALLQQVGDDPGPIHIHVAEQTREVDDCLTATGARPIEWLVRAVRPDARWQLVHATHATAAEIDAVAASGAGLVLCPSTEANLGDGLPDLPRWLAAGVSIAVGSDSQVARSWPEELRWLEYGQRLVRRERNIAASPEQPATAARLFEAALAGGARCAGRTRWGLVPGARADLIALDPQAGGLLAVPPSHLLDALVFASDAPPVRNVWVAGHRVLADGHHAREGRIATRFAEAMGELWT